jgi:hypothetical protein
MRLSALVLALLVLGCSVPVTVVQTVDDRPRLLVEGAPEGALLLIDGKLAGPVLAFSGNPGVLPVEAGTHLVEVKAGEKVVYSQKVFFGGGEQRKIVVAARGGF